MTEEFNNDEICDPKINTNLAKAINEVWGKKLTPEKLKIRLNKHLKPENCDQLSPTLVNMEIFSNIPAHTRSQDVKLQKMQKFLLKSAYPIVKILDSILTSNSSNNKPDHMLINKIKELTSDALAVLSQCNQELLQRKRDGITKNLSRKYKTLKHNVPDSRFTVPILAEIKKNRIQKTSRASREYTLQKLPSRRSHNRDRETKTSSSTKIKKLGKGHNTKLNNVIKTSTSKTDKTRQVT